MKTRLLSLALTLLCSWLIPFPLLAGVTSVVIDNPTDPDQPSGFVINDIIIDFTGQYFGAQLLTSDLGAGAIFEDIGGIGNSKTPNSALFGAIADLEFDSFTANGGLTSGADATLYNLGGAAVNLLPGVRTSTFSDSQIDQAWNPAAGVSTAPITDQSDFYTARITLFNTSNGTFSYLASAGDADDFTTITGTIVDGVMVTAVPEPSSWLCLGLIGSVLGARSYMRKHKTIFTMKP